jgi:hypothetical protein
VERKKERRRGSVTGRKSRRETEREADGSWVSERDPDSLQYIEKVYHAKFVGASIILYLFNS